MLGRVGADLVPKAAARALNRTASQAKQEAIRGITDEVGESGRSRLGLSKSIQIERASWGRLTATVWSRSKPLPLIYFNPTQTAEGVVVVIGGKRIVRPHAFIKKIYGARSVWLRKHRGTGSSARTPSGPLRGRFPIKKLYGPRAGSVMLSKRVLERVRAMVNQKFPELFEREIKYQLSRL